MADGPGLSCPVCGCEGVDILYREYSIYRCPRCTHAYYFSDGLSQEASGVYDVSYFKGEEYFDYTAEKPALSKNFKARLDKVLKYLGSGRLLEVGSAYGFFLELASAHFEVEGVEPVEEGVRHAREYLGLDVFCGDYTSRGLKPENYDVVCMWDVLEHLVSPRDVLEKISKEMRPGGILALTTGDISSLVAKARKANWRIIHPPSHVHYFSAGSLRRLLEDAGFELREIAYPGSYRSLGAVVYNVFVNDLRSKDRRGPGFIYAVARALAGVAVYMNTYDIMLVIASKRRR